MPLLVMISRISEQKGMDLLLKLLPVLLKEDLHFIFLGRGRWFLDRKIEGNGRPFSGYA